MNKITDIIARGMLGHIFLIAGLQKIGGYEGTQGYMESVGLPGMMLPLVILLEAGAGLAIIIGWKTRWAAAALALFSIASAALFHNNFSDQIQTIMFMKNIAIAGGLLLLTVYGAGTCSIDHRIASSNSTRE
ncbi:MAG TPA: DoxX family protein [Nitrosomonas sp.]|nr:DoxX family protein [Nitrosomonas sp.]HQX14396.1 DoxX family protein [Nitrosomonas sp.]HRB32472.1 DoxX family protein [Nitrosomonas sp.]HRB45311.1 DoxX family protein [Nitrosomonas sp.]HRB76443.1 DoxX family protein [Nitrosomonas sp.]